MSKMSGTANKRMVGVDSTAFTPKVPPPKSLTKDARKVWNEMIDMIPNDCIIPSDMPIMEAYCETMVQFRRSVQIVNLEGCIITTKSGVAMHPAATFMDKCSTKLAALSGKLRLAPNARKGIRSSFGEQTASQPTTELGKLLG